MMFCVKCGVNVRATGSECPRCHFDTLVEVTPPPLATLSTGTAVAARVARADKVWALYLSTDRDLDLDLVAPNSPVPFLSSAERQPLRLGGWLLLLFSTESAARRLFEQVVGDDGPTQSNPYNGPHRVYAYLAGPDGGITENT